MTTLHEAPSPSIQPLDRKPAATLLGAGVYLGRDRVKAGRSARRAAARPDEDAVTLAAEAAARALPADLSTIGGILLATTTPPYLEGASVQALAELLGVQGEVFALELSASLRDGLAAIRIAAALAPSIGPVLVCAAHAGAGDPTLGDGAVALLLGDPQDVTLGAGLGRLTPATSSAIEIRDRWRLPGDAHPRDADRSFVQAIATDRLSRDLLEAVPEQLHAPALVVGPDARASAALERAFGGPTDELTAHTGVVGAAHPLLRLVAGLDSPALVLSVSNGLGEALHVLPTPAATVAAQEARDAAEHGGIEVDRARPDLTVPDFEPYASAPRSWRDRDVDLRLRGLVGPKSGLQPVPGRRHPEGVVIARTEDRVYPAQRETELAVVRMDDGGQFYGQVAVGEHVAIGDRVKLVPRKLHHGAGIIQYFWKVTPCQ